MQFTEPTELTDALRIGRDRGVLPTTANSAQIAEWDEELKRLAIFLAGTNHAGYLQEVKDVVESLLRGKFDEATARMILQQSCGRCSTTRASAGFPVWKTRISRPLSLAVCAISPAMRARSLLCAR
jgi:hypothetical protein